MKSENTIDKLWEKLKELGDEERELIEVADMVSDVISGLVMARNKAGMTQRDLAKISNIKQTQIARVESLNTNPTLNTLVKLAYHVGAKITCKPKYDNNYVYIGSTIPQKYSTKTTNNVMFEYERTQKTYCVNECRDLYQVV